jgi:hypothetical protein
MRVIISIFVFNFIVASITPSYSASSSISESTKDESSSKIIPLARETFLGTLHKGDEAGWSQWIDNPTTKRIQTFQWRIDDNETMADVVVMEKEDDLGKTEQQMFINYPIPDGKRCIYRYEQTGSKVMSVFSPDYKGNLYTIWLGCACGYRFTIFSVADGEVYIALTNGTRDWPEIVLTPNAERIIAITDESFLFSGNKLTDRPSSALLYIERGKYFEFLGREPWSERMKYATGKSPLPPLLQNK